MHQVCRTPQPRLPRPRGMAFDRRTARSCASCPASTSRCLRFSRLAPSASCRASGSQGSRAVARSRGCKTWRLASGAASGPSSHPRRRPILCDSAGELSVCCPTRGSRQTTQIRRGTGCVPSGGRSSAILTSLASSGTMPRSHSCRDLTMRKRCSASGSARSATCTPRRSARRCCGARSSPSARPSCEASFASRALGARRPTFAAPCGTASRRTRCSGSIVWQRADCISTSTLRRRKLAPRAWLGRSPARCAIAPSPSTMRVCTTIAAGASLRAW
mmetsp:Transcript_28941/g.88783  ORF Transcript_28941/g.88783 Transcript_28941/m.88783 type:complete len:275 (-) Transcript_28941:304-1128(-)